MKIEVDVVTFSYDVVGSRQQKEVLQHKADQGWMVQAVMMHNTSHVIYLQRVSYESGGRRPGETVNLGGVSRASGEPVGSRENPGNAGHSVASYGGGNGGFSAMEDGKGGSWYGNGRGGGESGACVTVGSGKHP